MPVFVVFQVIPYETRLGCVVYELCLVRSGAWSNVGQCVGDEFPV